MVEVSPRRVLLPDCRGVDRHLRITWHSDTSTVVFSHWVGEVCTASTPVALTGATEVINLLVRALGEAASRPAATPPSRRVVPSGLQRLRDRLRPRLAEVIDVTTALLSRSGNGSGQARDSGSRGS